MKATRRGFTLIELLVVIAIIGLLAAIVLVSLTSARIKARDAKRLVGMQTIQTALELYNTKTGHYPATTPTTGFPTGSNLAQPWIPGLTSEYLASVPIDPINSASPAELLYYYESDSTGYCLQVSQEQDCSASPYYVNTWSGSCKLRVKSSPTYTC